jgi:hypothetical protein
MRGKDLESLAKERHEAEMRKRIFLSMRAAIQQQRHLHASEEKVKSARKAKVLSEVISTLNNMRQIR